MSATQNSSAVKHAINAVNAAGVAASFINDNLAPIFQSLVELSNIDSEDAVKLHVRMTLIGELAKLGCRLADEAAGHMESEELHFQSNLDLLQRGSA